MACRHEFLLGCGKEDILIDLKFTRAADLEVDALGAAEALEFVGFDVDAANLTLFGILGGDLVVEVVLAGDSKSHGLELHVEILGHQNGGVLFALLQGKAGRHDLVIHGLLVGEDLGKASHGRGGFLPAHGLVHEDTHSPASGGLHSAGYLLGLVIECLRQEAVDCPGIGATFRLLVFKAVQFAQDLDGNEDMVVLEAVEAVRVVK